MLNSRIVATTGALILFTITAIAIQIRNVSEKNKKSDYNLKAERSSTTPADIISDSKSTDDSNLFTPLPVPGPHDWLANHYESGQTFKEYLFAEKNDLSNKRNTIYILPMWRFDKDKSPDLELLKEYTERYFSVPVKLLPPVSPKKNHFSQRVNSHTGKEQLHAGEILNYLLKKLPNDGYCILGITMVDLYPDQSWNYVFGYASYKQRVGVFSFARFDRSFFNEKDSTDHKLLFLRSCKVLSHETGHMFGLAHCIAFHCNMNGSNNLDESDAQPLHLCPLCLKKLQYTVGFNMIRRYETLGKFYESTSCQTEATWINKRIKYLENK